MVSLRVNDKTCPVAQEKYHAFAVCYGGSRNVRLILAPRSFLQIVTKISTSSTHRKGLEQRPAE